MNSASCERLQFRQRISPALVTAIVRSNIERRQYFYSEELLKNVPPDHLRLAFPTFREENMSNLADVLAECTQLELRLGPLLDSSPLPLEPDLKTVESFVMDTYADAWAKTTERERNGISL
jgi:hypothetical protein